MKERTGLVTMKGSPLTLVGNEVNVGEKAPDFEVVANDLSTVKLSSFRGKVCVISSVHSLDTSVCDMETRRFNQEAARLGSEVVILTLSMDLPFAQKRFCEAEHVDRIRILSDHVWREFGRRYGVLIKDLGLLARAVFIIGRDGRIAYIEIVPEISDVPDYDAALNALRAIS